MKPMASVGQNKIRGTFLGDEVLAVNGSEAAICIYIYIYILRSSFYFGPLWNHKCLVMPPVTYLGFWIFTRKQLLIKNCTLL